jgi:hypothetical protein
VATVTLSGADSRIESVFGEEPHEKRFSIKP